MSQIYKKILIVKRFGVKKIGENATVKLNEAIKSLTPNSNRPHSRPQSASPPTPLRMERGVNSNVCQGFTAMKEGKITNADYTL